MFVFFFTLTLKVGMFSLESPALSRHLLPIGFFANSFQAAESHLTKVIVGAVVDIEVDIALDARQTSGIGVLPEFPTAAVLYGIDVIMGYPIGILVKDAVVKILELELIIGVDDGFHMIVAFHDVKPLEDRGFELAVRLLLGFVLHVKHGWQIAVLQFHLLQEELRLSTCRRMDAVEMIGAAGETTLTGQVEVLFEVLIDLR